MRRLSRGAASSPATPQGACRTTLDFFAVAEDDLSDVDVWEPVMGSATHEALMSCAARIADEDSEAEELLKSLFDAPAKGSWVSLNREL